MRWMVVGVVAICGNLAVIWTCSSRAEQPTHRERLVELFKRNLADMEERRYQALWADMSPTMRASVMASPTDPGYGDGYADFYAFSKAKPFYLGDYPGGKDVERQMPRIWDPPKLVGEPRVKLRFPAAQVISKTRDGGICFFAYAYIGKRWWLDSNGLECIGPEYHEMPEIPDYSDGFRTDWK